MVSRGFQRSPLEVVAMLAALAVFVSLLIVAYQLQRRKAHRRRLTLARTRYAELAQRKELGPAERELVDRLSAFLHDPEKKYLLLVSQTTFNYCAARLHGSDPSVDAGLAQLRLKLGFRIHGPEQIPASSAELPEGQSVEIAVGRAGRRLPGRVTGQRPSALMVRLEADSPTLGGGQLVSVYFQNRSGLFSFASRVEQLHEGSLALAHSEDIRRIQRRRYYRRKVALPVEVRRAGSDSEPRSSLILDLSGDGAGLRNPAQSFAAGEDLQLEFQAGAEQFALVAEVLRLSRGGRVMHVRFAPMRESARDRLIAAVSGSPLGGASGAQTGAP